MSLKGEKGYMVVLRVEGSIIVLEEALCKFKRAVTMQ